MQKKREVMKQSLELLQTIQEGLTHVQQSLNERKYDQTISLFEDAVYAFNTVENSVRGLGSEFVSDAADQTRERIVKGLDTAVGFYEQNAFGRVQETLQFTLIPAFEQWKKQLNLDFGKHLAH